jgi:hypothetical protein
MSQIRIYVVINRVTDEKRLVEATSQSQAIRHCVHTVYQADVASAKMLARYMGDGLKIEHASDSQGLPPTINQTTTRITAQQ